MRAIAVALVLLAGTSRGDDAPLAIDAGVPAPFAGLLLPVDAAVHDGKRIVACEAERDSLKTSVAASVPWWVVPVAVLLAGAAGAGVALAVKK